MLRKYSRSVSNKTIRMLMAIDNIYWSANLPSVNAIGGLFDSNT